MKKKIALFHRTLHIFNKIKDINLIFNSSFLFIFILESCSMYKNNYNISNHYKNFENKIEINLPTNNQSKEFRLNTEGDFVSIKKDNNKIYSGYITDNRRFLNEVIDPHIKSNINKLKKMNPVELINTLTLFSYELYRLYFGTDTYNGGFYRWGGDIFDLDDPQNEGIRYKCKYGLDCSGFVSMPYELAVYYDFFDFKEKSSLFSSKGFENFCKINNFTDTGGHDGTSNNYRVDSHELAILGETIFTVNKGEQPTIEQINKIQAGDIAGRPGHFGIIVEINKNLYYLESGGWVVPPRGGIPYPVSEAIKIFAEGGTVTIKRCLPYIR